MEEENEEEKEAEDAEEVYYCSCRRPSDPVGESIFGWGGSWLFL